MYASKELSKPANAPEPNTNMAQVSLRGSDEDCIERAALQFADCAQLPRAIVSGEPTSLDLVTDALIIGCVETR